MLSDLETLGVLSVLGETVGETEQAALAIAMQAVRERMDRNTAATLAGMDSEWPVSSADTKAFIAGLLNQPACLHEARTYLASLESPWPEEEVTEELSDELLEELLCQAFTDHADATDLQLGQNS